VGVLSHLEHLQKAIDYIEDNLNREISLDDCAFVAGFSKYHFHRLFGVYVGMPLMEYIRKRRLRHAMVDILHGKRILDIALEYGYGSERAFSRAFLQEFGQTPSQCRKVQYSIPPKPILLELSPMIGGYPMDYLSDIRIESLATMTVASAVRVSREPENDVIQLMNLWAQKRGMAPDTRNFGFDVPVSEQEEQAGLRGYEYWLVVDEGTPVSEGVQLKKVEGCKYAVLRITDPFADPFERIPSGWKKLVAWINEKGYKTSCDKERYWPEEVIEVDGLTYMDIYFPIE
jgi:AraC family transcriptional regulator